MATFSRIEYLDNLYNTKTLLCNLFNARGPLIIRKGTLSVHLSETDPFYARFQELIQEWATEYCTQALIASTIPTRAFDDALVKQENPLR